MRKSRIDSDRICVVILMVAFNTYAVFSQESIDFSYNNGSVLVHGPEIDKISHNPVHGFSVSYALKNKWGADWRQYYNYPNYGISYNFKSYNDPKVIGNSHSISGFLQLSFLKKRKYFDLGIKGLAGGGYITRIYDPELNPKNEAIGSHFNIIAEVRLYTKVRINPLYLEYSCGLSHISNGLIRSPNLGINVFNHSFTLGGELEEQATNYRSEFSGRETFIKNEFWAFVSTGFKETDYNSKKYIFTGISINYSKQVSVINKIGFGVDFSNDPSLTSFAEHFYEYSGEDDLGFRSGINIHNEFILGKTGLFTTYGLYLGNMDYYTRQRYYKAGFKFYFKNVIGVVLIRAIPLFRAEVVEFGIGYRITDRKFRNSENRLD